MKEQREFDLVVLGSGGAGCSAALAGTALGLSTCLIEKALLLGGGVIYLALGDLQEAVILLVFASMSVLITVVQEARTERVLEALRDLTSPRALVIRDGVRREPNATAGGIAFERFRSLFNTAPVAIAITDPDGIPGPGQAGALAFQWLSGGKPIAGANGTTFVPSQAQVGLPLSEPTWNFTSLYDDSSLR